MNGDIPKQIIAATKGSPETVIDLNERKLIVTGRAAEVAVDHVLSSAKPTNSEVAPGGVRGLSVTDFDSRAELATTGSSDHTRHTVDPEGNDRIVTHLAA